MILLIANIIRHNQTLTRLDLINLGTTKYFLSLGDMLRDNPNHIIQYISLSGSKIDNIGMLAVAIALEKFRHILKGLDLSNCNISGKRASILMNAFQRNYAMSISIEELNLSFNKFDTDSSKTFEKWLFEAKEFSHLKNLSLESSNLNMVVISRAFRSLRFLQELNISGNKLEQGSVELLCVAIDESHTLKKLNVSSCSLKAPLIQKITLAILENRALEKIFLDISNNICSSKNSNIIADGFKKGHNLYHLRFCGYKWKPEALILLLKNLARKRNLDTLILDNSCRKTRTGNEELARALSLTLKHTPSLKALSLNFGFDLVIPFFLEKLQKNQSLLELSIENNHLKDKGAYHVSEMLRLNSHLMLLKLDYNSIYLNGWKSILLAFEMNKTLIEFPYPWNDLQQYCSSSSSSTNSQNHLKNILDRIQHQVNTNFHPSSQDTENINSLRKYSLFNQTKIQIPPKTVENLPSIPQHLEFLQKEAQSQFEEQQVYWMVNDTYDQNTTQSQMDYDEFDYDFTSWDPFADDFHLDENSSNPSSFGGIDLTKSSDSSFSNSPFSSPSMQRPNTPVPLPNHDNQQQRNPPSSLIESLGARPQHGVPTPPRATPPSLDEFK